MVAATPWKESKHKDEGKGKVEGKGNRRVTGTVIVMVTVIVSPWLSTDEPSAPCLMRSLMVG